MKANISLLILLILFSLVSCSKNPNAPMEAVVTSTFTPYVGGTETALSIDFATPTPWVAGTEMALASPTPFVPDPLPTSTPPIMEKPADFSPVLYGQKYDANTFFLLLGGVSKDSWLTPEESVARFSGGATYSLHTLQQADRYFFWGRPPENSPIRSSFTIGTDIDVEEVGMVAVLDGWNVTKHAMIELSADGRFYQQVVVDWLDSQGMIEPQLRNLQILSVDIEGDGVDEVFISASHLDDSQHMTKAGDYSIVLMRKVDGNNVVTIPLVADIYSSQGLEITFPRTYSIGNFIDLNQDGVLEVVVDIQKWEGFGAIVYQINDQDIIQTLRVEC